MLAGGSAVGSLQQPSGIHYLNSKADSPWLMLPESQWMNERDERMREKHLLLSMFEILRAKMSRKFAARYVLKSHDAVR
jgi:hypothetical protein